MDNAVLRLNKKIDFTVRIYQFLKEIEELF